MAYSNISLNGITLAGTGSGYSTGYSIGSTSGTNGSWSAVTTASASYNYGNVKISDTDITIDGISVKNTLVSLNERLAILIPNPKLEKDFDQLRKLREEYQALEKELLEQAKVWDVLKKP